MRRIWEHRNGIRSRFASRYSVYRLVWWEAFGDIELAIRREKQLKRWHRPWKVNLIEAGNPYWDDLAVALGFEPLPETLKRQRPSNPSFQDPVRKRLGSGGLDPETSSG
jgi:putative endonuclease